MEFSGAFSHSESNARIRDPQQQRAHGARSPGVSLCSPGWERASPGAGLPHGTEAGKTLRPRPHPDPGHPAQSPPSLPWPFLSQPQGPLAETRPLARSDANCREEDGTGSAFSAASHCLWAHHSRIGRLPSHTLGSCPGLAAQRLCPARRAPGRRARGPLRERRRGDGKLTRYPARNGFRTAAATAFSSPFPRLDSKPHIQTSVHMHECVHTCVCMHTYVSVCAP